MCGFLVVRMKKWFGFLAFAPLTISDPPTPPSAAWGRQADGSVAQHHLHDHGVDVDVALSRHAADVRLAELQAVADQYEVEADSQRHDVAGGLEVAEVDEA